MGHIPAKLNEFLPVVFEIFCGQTDRLTDTGKNSTARRISGVQVNSRQIKNDPTTLIYDLRDSIMKMYPH